METCALYALNCDIRKHIWLHFPSTILFREDFPANPSLAGPTETDIGSAACQTAH